MITHLRSHVNFQTTMKYKYKAQTEPTKPNGLDRTGRMEICRDMIKCDGSGSWIHGSVGIVGDADGRVWGVLMNCAFAYSYCGHCLNIICKMSMFVWFTEMLK